MNKNILYGSITLIVILIIGGGILYSQQVNQSTTEIVKNNNMSHLNPEEFKKAVDSEEYTIIDVRTEGEFSSGYIAGATQSDIYKTEEFDQFLNSLEKDKKYLVYCRSGARSAQALNLMKENGLNAQDLSGGISSWTASGYPIKD